MKIFLKTITGKVQELDVTESTTVLEIKRTFEAEYDLNTLRLCYKGSILADTATVEDIKLAENATLIITGKKCSIPKPPQPALSNTSGTTPSASANPTALPEVSSEVQPPHPQPTPQPRVATTAAAPTPTPPPARANPDAAAGVSSELIDGIVAMGFEDRAQVALALRAAFMNPDRAVEYLCTGIPPNLLQELSHPTQPVGEPAPTPGSSAPTRPSNATRVVSRVQPEPGSSDLRTALWTIPRFENIRAVFQANQESLPVVIEQIRDRYPHIFQLIEANQAEFLQVMNETAGRPANPMTEEAGGNITDTIPIELHLTESDHMAVQQLVELGGGMWDEQSALMVYIAAQRNQEIAANVLFENGGVPPDLLEQFAAHLQNLGNMDNDEPDDMEGRTK